MALSAEAANVWSVVAARSQQIPKANASRQRPGLRSRFEQGCRFIVPSSHINLTSLGLDGFKKLRCVCATFFGTATPIFVERLSRVLRAPRAQWPPDGPAEKEKRV